MPLAVVGIFAAFIVWLIATIPVAIEILFLLIPWSIGWVATVNVPLARMLFWFFGHPLVYFWLLPTYVMYYTMLPKLAAGSCFPTLPAASPFSGSCSIPLRSGFIINSPSPGSAAPGNSCTLSLPCWWRSRVSRLPSRWPRRWNTARARTGGRGLLGWWNKLPYLDKNRWLFSYFFAGLFIFIFGGVTGIINASYNLDNVVHNTSWLPAHFHQTVAGPVFLSYIGMSLFLVAKLTGKEIKFPSWNVWVPYIWTLGIMIFSTGLIHRRRRRRTASHEHGIDLHQSAVATLSCRLAVGRKFLAASAELS